MKPLEVLKAEHHTLLQVMTVLERLAQDLERREAVPAALIDDVLQFCQVFGDQAHHAKEEALFPLLARRGLGPDDTGINALVVQHEACRAYVREMRTHAGQTTHGDVAAALALAATARDYVSLLREHIRLEDSYVFAMASDKLTAGDNQKLARQFSDIDRGIAGRVRGAHDIVEEFQRFGQPGGGRAQT